MITPTSAGEPLVPTVTRTRRSPAPQLHVRSRTHSSRTRIAHAAPTADTALAALADHPLLSATEEAQLLSQAHRGDSTARDELVRCNMRLVLAVATSFTGASYEKEDLVQEGVLGLLHAIEKWRPDRRTRLSTYAVWWIRRAMTRALHNYDRLVRVPVNVHERASRVAAHRRAWEAKHGHSPTNEELAAATGMRAATLRGLLRALEQPVSLSAPAATDETQTLLDALGATTDVALAVETRECNARLAAALRQLDPRSQLVMVRRYGLDGLPPAKLQTLADCLTLSRERVRQIEERALADLLEQLRDLDPAA